MKFVKNVRKEWLYLVMMIPGLVLTAIFSYGPLYGIVMAFQDYNPGLGFTKSPWVGFENFKLIFSQPAFLSTIYNTFFISI
ncbi:MAG: sugar ABC transporter permease, partial [Clostridia bacterium]|nr:sugar ABC transporter permease [Clostridia bacterium]